MEAEPRSGVGLAPTGFRCGAQPGCAVDVAKPSGQAAVVDVEETSDRTPRPAICAGSGDYSLLQPVEFVAELAECDQGSFCVLAEDVIDEARQLVARARARAGSRVHKFIMNERCHSDWRCAMLVP